MNSIATACALALFAAPLAAAPAPAAAQNTAEAAKAEDIVVTGRRSGIPVWRVGGPETSVVLVGSIAGVTKETRWDPGSLTDALRKSDRVMFPGMQQLSASPFALVGYLAKWRGQRNLPAGQTLADVMPPDQYARLVALQRKGVLKKGWERKHPLHLAIMLREQAKGRSEYGLDATDYVRKAVGKYKLRQTPIATGKAKGLAQQLFDAPPQVHLPCLADAIALAEAGPGVVQARSRAWAERRVPAVLASPASAPYRSCFPSYTGEAAAARARIRPAVRTALTGKEVTIAVIDLGLLAGKGGILDELAAAGHEIQGPAWK